MGIPHKHAALIKAWADGAEIQWRQCEGDAWKPASLSLEYRVKPEKQVRYVNVYSRMDCGKPHETFVDALAAAGRQSASILKLTFEDQEVVGVSIVKENDDVDS